MFANTSCLLGVTLLWDQEFWHFISRDMWSILLHVEKIYDNIILESFFLILELFLLQNFFHMGNVIKWSLDFVEALQSVLVGVKMS